MSASPIFAETLYAPRRRKTVPVTFGGVTIGGDAPVLVQSMKYVPGSSLPAPRSDSVNTIASPGL